ncbi:transaldolase [Pseudoclavibacter chungangensis]|uniref:Transaldolase n=1 Tax=Pseudoclavibacter chungangensis TaxID=587635 RepID=A0A7J5BVA1_9MICO|nr:transaldolase [Pseudoclavibacter chungangensis]KAB1657782.1 transaldolase [Pseudoclavibacter chungangensis]NYJ66630.1 transaldolase [Pseudoclavibacter chungangensis]
MTETPTKALSEQGVSIWLDDLSRDRLQSGTLAALIDSKDVVGVTTNPTIFAGALAKGTTYGAQLAELAAAGTDVDEAIFTITTDDVRDACDVFAPVFERTNGVDGRVSIEVSPTLARDTQATIDEAKRLWATVDRPNALIKIPATAEGLPAITEVIASGISVNVTLIFSLDRYREVINAYLTGLELARERGNALANIHSVASFFVSRVDVEVDKRLDALDTPRAAELRSKAALANARLAYQVFEEAFGSERATLLVAEGANRQRPLWASTGVKDPALPDTLYVTELVAPETVNTMPEKTLDALADHGVVTGNTIEGTAHDANQLLDDLAELGIDYDDVVGVLETEGVDKFIVSWEELRDTVRTGLDEARATA